ncbi:hypothetical protein BHECKSOX2_22 [Bathymodiolus heckerae thiotrophic gill symbiont]|uniref:hypothetical protein n=1 Tax=Bathymodiolus heckerae thiotrophic gill symbiont TaxID=1052212 RepID=UPI0010B1B91F|nr:hypothetical protein [Bathymodiolus heckerae thiotrophic gill symbiont]SMN13049.1 hypothetical protein BHECKSOX2_22 [Bathymodiolus heckerae thiotrophic gill symbiont]
MKNPFSKLESWLQNIALEVKIKNLLQASKNHIKRYYRSYHIPFLYHWIITWLGYWLLCL